MLQFAMTKNTNFNYWVYILLCENNTFYTGYTNNLTKRYAQHVSNTGRCKYTRSFKPISIIQSWQVSTKSHAMRLENFIKRLTRAEKEYLIIDFSHLC